MEAGRNEKQLIQKNVPCNCHDSTRKTRSTKRRLSPAACYIISKPFLMEPLESICCHWILHGFGPKSSFIILFSGRHELSRSLPSSPSWISIHPLLDGFNDSPGTNWNWIWWGYFLFLKLFAYIKNSFSFNIQLFYHLHNNSYQPLSMRQFDHVSSEPPYLIKLKTTKPKNFSKPYTKFGTILRNRYVSIYVEIMGKYSRHFKSNIIFLIREKYRNKKYKNINDVCTFSMDNIFKYFFRHKCK